MLDLSWREIAMGLLSLVTLGIGGAVKKARDDIDKKADAADLKDAITEWRIDRARADQGRSDLHEKVNEVARGVERIKGKLGID